MGSVFGGKTRGGSLLGNSIRRAIVGGEKKGPMVKDRGTGKTVQWRGDRSGVQQIARYWQPMVKKRKTTIGRVMASVT